MAATQTPYQVLGVKPDASADDIRKAYRKLAKQFHPDLNPGKAEAEDRFKSISAAYDLLSDAEKRGRYDRGEIDESGSAGRRRGTGEGFRARGADRHFTLTIDLVIGAVGGKQRLSLAPDEWLDVTIPPGIEDGQVLRLRGKGGPGFGGGQAGDALIEVRVAPHPLFRRDGDNILLELPVSLAEAVLGARVSVPTVTGPVTMTIPKGSDTGRQLRLRGKGIQKTSNPGDEIVTLKVVIGQSSDPELAEFLEKWAPRRPFDPRQGMPSA